jgi:predicted signal transduction protein with EAL and GGDEF domain
LGGDEFAVLLDGIGTDADAVRVGQRLLTELSKTYRLHEHTVHNTVSIGITTSSIPYASAADMLRDADTAMYRAKRDGRSRIAMFDQHMHAEAVTRLTLEADLRAAIEQDQIVLYYQPILSLPSRQLSGFEALARWQHAQHGAIPPSTFIPVAEETGMVLELGLRLLRRACAQLAAWQALRPPQTAPLTMSVNVSRRQLVAPDFVQQVQSVIAETGMSDPQAAYHALRELRDLGVQLHMDDFGTGYSSLSCLQNFPLSGLKMDRGFISDLSRTGTHGTITRAVVMLAHSLNMPLVAEGVETWEQLKALEGMDCDLVQGFLLGKPMAVAAAQRFIEENVADQRAA